MQATLALLSAAGLVRDALRLVLGAAVAVLLALAFTLASLASLVAPPPAVRGGERAAGLAAGPPAPGAVPGPGARDWVIAFGFAQPYGAAQFSASLPIHRGVDIQLRGQPNGGHGQPYTPFVPGVVVALTSDPFGGNGVILQDARGLYHRYFHNLRVLVRPGQAVDTGTPLALLGDTGSPGFPHVHYEVSRRINGDPVGELTDPRPFMGARP